MATIFKVFLCKAIEIYTLCHKQLHYSWPMGSDYPGPRATQCTMQPAEALQSPGNAQYLYQLRPKQP